MVARKSPSSKKVYLSGEASAESGGLAVSGMVDTVNFGALPLARSRYKEQLRLIAPDELLDRRSELLDLTGFCEAEDPAPAYVWWRAPPWAGKSALMAWFVLHPPAGVRLVPFFVTARYSGNSDQTAFFDVVIEQLAELLEQPVPAFLTPANRYSHLLGMLGDAASACRERGDRLVLVIDGLDEDRGVVAGPDAHSIAALLPAVPPAGMRVVVAGRPNPEIPSDVPAGHPLRDTAVVRGLTPSPYAVVVRQDAERELKRLLHGTLTEQDILGLLTAAGGGLSAADLAELTEREAWEIDELLGAVSGRTFVCRLGRWIPESLYLLGHEELQQSALRYLGSHRLRDYRRRLHDWADGYRGRGWPPGTPEYLLSGYFRLLGAICDIERMVAVATDAGRHGRMLDISSGDNAALTEIAAAHEAVLNRPDLDLTAVSRLALHGHLLTRRSATTSVGLVMLWAKIGNLPRAEAIARSMTDPRRQEEALAALAPVVAADGDVEAAEAIVDSLAGTAVWVRAVTALGLAVASVGDAARAERLVRSIPDSYSRETALAALAPLLVSMGEAGRGELTAATLTTTGIREDALVGVARALAEAGEIERALAIGEEASNPYLRTRIVRTVAGAVAEAGAFEAAAHIVADAEGTADVNGIAGLLATLNDRGEALAAFIQATAAYGDLPGAERLALSGGDSENYGRVHIALVTAYAEAGDVDHADALAAAMDDLTDQEEARTAVAIAVAAHGDLDTAESLVRSIADPYQGNSAALALAPLIAATGDLDRAVTLALSTSDPRRQNETLVEVARALAEHGNGEGARLIAARAEGLMRAASFYPEGSAAFLLMVARTLAEAGDQDGARAAIAESESFVCGISEQNQLTPILNEVLRAAIAVGDLDHAGRVLRRMADSHVKVRAVGLLGKAYAEAGQMPQVEDLGRLFAAPYQRSQVLSNLAGTVAASGHRDRAMAMSAEVSDPYLKARALVSIAQSAAAEGDLPEAESIASSIADPYLRASALISLLPVLVRAWGVTWAERIIDSIADEEMKARARNAVVPAVVALGEADLAFELVASTRLRHLREQGMVDLAYAVTLAGDGRRGQLIADDIEEFGSRNQARDGVVVAMAVAGDLERAAELVKSSSMYRASKELGIRLVAAGQFDRAETIVKSIYHVDDRDEALLALTTALASRARFDEAERACHSIKGRARFVVALHRLAVAAGQAGQLNRAEAIARSIPEAEAVAHALAGIATVIGPEPARYFAALAIRSRMDEVTLRALARCRPEAVRTLTAEYLGIMTAAGGLTGQPY